MPIASNTSLAERKCSACEKGQPPLKSTEISRLREQLGEGWKIVDQRLLEKEYSFRNFREALDFTNRVGALAEEQNHHPDVYLSWGKVKLTLSTHSIGGLSENDFILAAKLDVL